MPPAYRFRNVPVNSRPAASRAGPHGNFGGSAPDGAAGGAFERRAVDGAGTQDFDGAGRDHEWFGRAQNPWLTGTAGWMYTAATKWILGVRPTLAGLVVDPCIPPAHSPAANSPGTPAAVLSGSTSMPPIT